MGRNLSKISEADTSIENVSTFSNKGFGTVQDASGRNSGRNSGLNSGDNSKFLSMKES
jgi:hypothetical protein